MIKIYKVTKRLNAMAIINPKLCNKLSIQVEVEQRDEGPIPHLHCYHNKHRSKKECAYICLNKVEYAPFHKSKHLDKDKKEEFIKLMNTMSNDFMESKNGEIVRLTGYQSAVKTWVETFENGNYDKFQIDDKGLPIQLDYTKLK